MCMDLFHQFCCNLDAICFPHAPSHVMFIQETGQYSVQHCAYQIHHGVRWCMIVLVPVNTVTFSTFFRNNSFQRRHELSSASYCFQPPPREVEEKDLVPFTLKVRVWTAVSAPVYNRKVARFANVTQRSRYWFSIVEKTV